MMIMAYKNPNHNRDYKRKKEQQQKDDKWERIVKVRQLHLMESYLPLVYDGKLTWDDMFWMQQKRDKKIHKVQKRMIKKHDS